MINEVYAKYTAEPSFDVDNKNIGKLILVKDLRNGNIVSSAILKADGKFDSITSTRFTVIEGIPIIRNEEVLTFGKINGVWGITTRTTINKSNIKIFRNNGERK